MEMTNASTAARRRAAVNGLAAVGFVALIITGIMLAVYAARFVPQAASSVSSAAVYLSHVFTPKTTPDLQIVSQIPFTGETASTTTSTTTVPVATTTKPVTTGTGAVTAGPETTKTYPANGGTTAPLYGLSDLKVTIIATGYLTTNDTNSFVASSNVPNGMNGAIKFDVTNVGTNVTGPWNFKAILPTINSYTFNSDQQLSLRPGEHITFTLGFDRARVGNQTVTVTADADKNIVESDENNNTDTASINIQ